jgi:cholesterol transport system auxiliary component
MLLSSLALLALAGCSISPTKEASPQRFELNVPAAASPAALPIADISLRAPSWLETSQMGYRLRYAKASRREVYARSRWVASPAELVMVGLKRGLPQSGQGGCRLRVELDEFVQDFSSANESVGRIEARVRLMVPKGEGPVRRFEVVASAGFADAEGGAEALNEAMQKWLGELRTWLGQEAKTLAGACKA